jgi:hypothetical protein
MDRVKKKVSYTYYNNLAYGVVADAIVIVTAQSPGTITLASNTWNNIGTMPSNYHPNHEWSGIVALRNIAGCSIARINTNGIFACYNDSASSINYWHAMIVYTI